MIFDFPSGYGWIRLGGKTNKQDIHTKKMQIETAFVQALYIMQIPEKYTQLLSQGLLCNEWYSYARRKY